ncbi:MAG TPA: hypothetical protein VGF14_00170 [Alphaproteobacteria bacterium]
MLFMYNKIIAPRAFFDQVVVPDCNDVLANPDDVRLVFHACASLHHLKEWIFHAGISGFSTLQDFGTDVNARCPALVTIRELAVNAKHFAPTTVEQMEVGVSIATLPYGSGLYGTDLYGRTQQDQVLARTVGGRTEWLPPLIKEGLQFWQEEFVTRGW